MGQARGGRGCPGRGGRVSEAEAEYLAPAEPTKILAVHLTYRSRVEEYAANVPPQPSYFLKPTTTLNGHRGVIRRPRGTEFLNYEGELAVIVGRRMKGVAEEDALSYVGGYTCANDVGLHDFRHADRGSMLRVKGQDGFLPLGPEVVSAEEFDPEDFRLRTYLNGEVVQEGGSDDLIFPVAYQLADLCRLITLEPGDVVLTGTPANSRSDGAGRHGRGGDRRHRTPDEYRRGVGRGPHRARRAARDLGQYPARRPRRPGGRGREDGLGGWRVKPVLIRQHEEMTPPGLLVEWLEDRGISYEVHYSYKDGSIPDPSDYSFVASLGSPYGPNDTHEPGVVTELELIGAAVEKDIPVLGLCFGGEVLSAVLGGRVERAPVPELGWREIETDDPGAIPSGPWLEWHYERFTTPPGAVEVARTADAVQAFRLGPHLGVQFHPESTVEIVADWAGADTENLAKLGIEDGRDLLAIPPEREEAAREAAFRLFDAFLAEAATHGSENSAGGAGGKE